jgi:hypothetical protein
MPVKLPAPVAGTAEHAVPKGFAIMSVDDADAEADMVSVIDGAAEADVDAAAEVDAPAPAAAVVVDDVLEQAAVVHSASADRPAARTVRLLVMGCLLDEGKSLCRCASGVIRCEAPN